MYQRQAYEELTVYALPTIKAYLSKHNWAYITAENYQDIQQELTIALMKAISTYDPNKHVRLFSWMYSHYRFTCLDLSKKENPYREHMVQQSEIGDIHYEPEDEL